MDVRAKTTCLGLGALSGALSLLWVGGCSSDTPNNGVTTTPPPEAGAGCEVPPLTEGDDPCTAPLAPGSSRKCTFEFAGKKRSFLLYAPANYDPCTKTPLVVDAHGASETAEAHAGLERFRTWPEGLGSGWRLLADREGFLVLTPQGIDNVWVDSDVNFLLEVEKMTTGLANVDPEKVFLTGISNGGQITYSTACSDPNVFHGYAPISGWSSAKSCAITHSVPMIGFHSETDALIPYKNGKESASEWAKSNHCKKGPTPSLTFGGAKATSELLCLESEADDKPPWRLAPCNSALPETTCESWEDCDDGNKVIFCTVPGDKQPVGGHILYFNDTKLSLAAVTWQFFKQ